jgi:hypothetical protein
MSRQDDDLDLLLARGRLGGPGREQVLRQTLDRAAPRRRWLWVAPLTAACAAAAALLLVVRPTEFRARGVDGGALLEVTCADGARDRCRSGELLVFRVDGASTGGRLAAWAEPEGGGARVWYFPTVEGALPQVAAQPGPQVLHEAVRIGAEQPPGSYVVHLLLLPAPLARAEIESAQPQLARTQRMEVTGR